MRRAHRTAHRRIWALLAVLLPAVLMLSLVARRTGPLEFPSIQLAPPK
jgi:hypothetical protein